MTCLVSRARGLLGKDLVAKAYIASTVETGWTVQQDVEVIGVMDIPHCLKQ